ncbi:hypothetical protein TFKS16_1223 [Tannerella forsythia KS16]|nr:hypothetical protein TF3313_0870 [Tannerella forsythia 3313]BAR51490.1 hypothetical protein TFKS16_1223 [Tannerella forsythia KS16]
MTIKRVCLIYFLRGKSYANAHKRIIPAKTQT